MNKLLASLIAVAFTFGTISAYAADEMKKEGTKMEKKASPKKATKAGKKTAKKDEMKKEEMKK